MFRFAQFARAVAVTAVLMSSSAAFAVATVENDSNPIPTPAYKVDLNQSSVSGISSGAYMAQQFHVANSAWVIGAGIMAGGPYFCTQNDVNNGVGRCMQGGITQTNLDTFWQEAVNQAQAGRIDPVANLANDRVWLFHGKLDQAVKEQVMDSLKTWYQMAGIPAGNILYERERSIQHTWPTQYYSYPGDSNGNTNACSGSNPDYPWLGQCNWDSAGDMLQHIYGPLNPRNAGTLSGTVKAIRQSDHFNAGGYGAPASMNPKAYIYVPASCVNGATCKLHVAFHGCEMNYDTAPSAYSSDAGPVYGLKHVLNSGLNEWADTNNIIVLYPQAKKSSLFPTNPKGCWDFWNYEGGGVPHTKQGKQIDAVRDMMKKLASGGGLPPTPTGLTVTGTTSNSVTLSWNASAGATSYKVYRGSTHVGSPTGTSYTDSGLTAGTAYTYQVSAVNAAGESSKSSSVSATTGSGGGTCFTANNVDHVTAGRAYTWFGSTYANGSNQYMGAYSTSVTKTLKMTGTNYYVIGTC